MDTIPSYSYRTTYNSEGQAEKTDTLIYYSGAATIRLFDRTITLPAPRLEDGERLTREYLLKAFKESSFYMNLAKIAGIEESETAISRVEN